MRLAGQIKGGHYPTPPISLAQIVRHLHYQENVPVRLLDPCAGHAEAIIAAAMASPTPKTVEILAVENAVKHGNATEVQLSAVPSREGVEIAVDDNGSGIPEAERTVVFERFSRGSNASVSGSGLGLALVAQQAELHGGTASLGQSPLGGARLLLKLPGHPQARTDA